MRPLPGIPFQCHMMMHDMAEWGTRKSVWKSLSSNHPEVGIHCTALGADTLDFDDQRGDREILNFGFLGLMKNDGDLYNKRYSIFIDLTLNVQYL